MLRHKSTCRCAPAADTDPVVAGGDKEKYTTEIKSPTFSLLSFSPSDLPTCCRELVIHPLETRCLITFAHSSGKGRILCPRRSSKRRRINDRLWLPTFSLYTLLSHNLHLTWSCSRQQTRRGNTLNQLIRQSVIEWSPSQEIKNIICFSIWSRSRRCLFIRHRIIGLVYTCAPDELFQ